MGTLADMLIKVSADTAQAEKYLGKVEKSFDKFGSNLQGIGTKLTTGITLPLVALGGVAFKAGLDFETAFAGVKKTVEASDTQLATMRQGIRDMAKEIPTSATALAGIAEAAGQLGVKTDNILGFTKVIADLGVATNLSGEEGATMLARFANITQMPQGEFSRLGSTIVALGNAGASTEQEIMAMGLRLAGAGSQVGMTEAQILSFANALSSVGIEADAGGSAFSKVMIDIAQAVDKGGAKLDLFAKTAGVSTSSFKTAFKTDAAGAIVTFIEGLGKVQASGGSTFGVLDELGLSEIRVRDALLRASGAGDSFRSSLETGNTAWQQNIALTKEAEQRYGTNASQIEIMKNKFNDVMITLGDALAPAFTKAMTAAQPLFDGIMNLATGFANLDPGAQQFIITLAAVAAAIGPVLYIAGVMMKAWSGAVGVFKLVTGSVGFLNAAFTFLAANPIVLVIAAIVALIAIGYLIYKNWDEVSAFLIKTWAAIQTMAASVWNGIAAFFTGLWTSITTALSKAWTTIMGAITTAWNGIADFFRKWIGVILIGIFTGGLGLLLLLLWKNWDLILQGIVTAWTTITSTITTWATNAWNAVVGVLKALPGWFTGMWSQAVTWTTTGWANLVSSVTTGAKNVKDGLINGLEEAWTYLKGLPSKLLEWGKNAIKSFAKGFLSIKIPLPSFSIDWKDGPLGIKIPSLNIGVNWKDLSSFVPFLANGGIVDSPTLAMIGEAGPEAVVPLSKFDGGGGGGGNTVIVNWSGVASEAETRRLAGEVNRLLGSMI